MHQKRRDSERGAVFIHVAIGLLVLMAFMAFVADYGMLWVARAQAQASADGGALAGAASLAYDNKGTGAAAHAGHVAWNVGIRNPVWGDEPGVRAQTPYSGLDDSLNIEQCIDAPNSCIRVDSYRNGTNDSVSMPTWFANLFGTATQGIRAMAVAQAGAGNASECLKPWGVADKWIENNPTPGPWTPTATFDPTGGNPDVYTPPSATDPGSGFTLENDLGTEIKLKVGSPHDAINPGWFQALDLTGGGGNTYRQHIAGCANILYKFGDTIAKENGNMVGPTGQGTNDLIDLDPNADWDPVNKQVINSCIGPPYTCSVAGLTHSPRIVAIPIFDLAEYTATGGPGNGTVRIVNILGFFVDRIEAPQNTVVGYLATIPSLKVAGGGSITPESSFARIVQLIR
jgi:hypothetical protein